MSEKTDWAKEKGKSIDDLDKCSWCDVLYDADCEGHYDENTALRFCDVGCEDSYNMKKGLPENYVLPFIP